MNLINRYVAEVGKHLSFSSSRADIEKELKSTLEDMLEDRARKAGRSADEAMEIELLKEYGAPDKVAATYDPHPYLIGPRMFPFFTMILKMVIFGIMVGLSVVTGIQIISQMSVMGSEFVNIVGQGISGIISTSIAAFGYVVLAFAIIERIVPASEFKIDEKKEWDPASLMKEPGPDEARRGELIAEIIFTFLGLAILNLYPQVLGIGFFADEKWLYVPIFSAAFFTFIPWINFTFLAEILLDIFLLRTALWTRLTRVIKVVIEAASLAITVTIFRTPNIIGFTAESFTNMPIDPETAQTLTTIFTTMFPITLTVIMIIQGIELAKAVYRLFKIQYRTK
ncbi:MAG: hypothetical protein HZB50_02815 [Chloroflexi bacterium]|nr:hypothetical protein [Chloroflexota bacterium]